MNRRAIFSCASIVLLGLSGIATLAKDKPAPLPPPKSSEIGRTLASVSFAADDDGKIIYTLSITETSRVTARVVRNWANQGGWEADPHSHEEAAQCLALLKTLAQPTDLPGSENRIVTISCRDGETMLVRKFPIDRLPPEVREILSTMGFLPNEIERLKFLPKTESSAAAPQTDAAPMPAK